MLECVTGRDCFGCFTAVQSPMCKRCPDLFRCAKYESDRAAYYEWLLTKRWSKKHGKA